MADEPASVPDLEPPDGSFSGQLSEIPLFLVLRRIQRHRLSGTLSIFRGDQVRQLFLEKGELRSARSSREDHRIGATLVRWGYLSENDLAEALEIQKSTNRRIDQVLVEKGLVTRAVIESEARRQMEQIIFSTMAWPDATFHFEANTGPVEIDVGLSFSEDVIIEGIRRIPESEQFVELLGDLKSVPRLTRDAASSSAFRMLRDAVDILGHIDGKTTFEKLLQASTSGGTAAKVLYSLLFAGLIETGERPRDAQTQREKDSMGAREPGRPEAEERLGEARTEARPEPTPSASGAHPSVRGASATGAFTDERRFVLDTFRQLDWLSHYDLLGVSRTASRTEIDEAFTARSRLFDPSHPELSDLWRHLIVLDKWLKVAHNVLSDPVTRAAYDKKIDEATPPLEQEPAPTS